MAETADNAQQQKGAQNSASTARTIGKPFPPGVSGNPGGRPKRKLISEAYRDILETEGAEKYAQVIATDAVKAKNASDRRQAVQEITDRVEGKAVQAHRVEIGMDESTAKALVELADKLLSNKADSTHG